MKFSDTTNKDGILQMIEQTTGLGDTTISGDTILKAYFTNLINYWYRLSAFFAWRVDKNWKFDDTNQTTFPMSTTTLVDGQRDYTLPTTALNLRQVEILDNSGKYYTISFIPENDTVLNTQKEQEESSLPSHYRLVGNSLILYPAPLASSVTTTEGLRITTDREVDAFIVSDTTKEPGIPLVLQPILYYGACLEWSSVKGIANVQALCTRMLGNFPGLTEVAGEFYGKRNQDITPAISRQKVSYK